MASNEEQIRKTLMLAGVAVLALGLLMLATQYVQQRGFWRELDDWRTDNRLAEFLEWEREHPPEPDGESGTDSG
jgi:hypothetical protein